MKSRAIYTYLWYKSIHSLCYGNPHVPDITHREGEFDNKQETLRLRNSLLTKETVTCRAKIKTLV